MGHDVWVFGYGSLMWRPGFAHNEAVRARLSGFHRAFCVYSVLYRGSPARPGLVLGLDRGGSCEGIAFRLPPERAGEILRSVRRRELVYGVYREALVPVALADGSGRTVPAHAYVAERAHRNYAGEMPLATQAALIRRAHGTGGANLDYLINTVAHLGELGIRERPLERLLSLAGAFAAHGHADGGARPRALSLARAWSRVPLVHTRTPRRATHFAFRKNSD